jgi:hypothetical protein
MLVKKEEMNCFEVRIGLIAFFAAMTVGMVWNIAYGETGIWNTIDQINKDTQAEEKAGTLMKHKGEFYCYDETTTTKKEVLKAIKHDWMTGVTEMNNGFLTGMATPDNPNNMTDKAESLDTAKTLCQTMVAKGSFSNDDYNDYIEATITWEFDWDD